MARERARLQEIRVRSEQDHLRWQARYNELHQRLRDYELLIYHLVKDGELYLH